MNFDFSIMKQLWDVGHEKLINIIGSHGILDVFMDVSHTLAVNGHLCSKSAQKR
jgi:hypothetical protein